MMEELWCTEIQYPFATPAMDKSSSNPQSPIKKNAEEPTSNKAGTQCLAISIYKTKIDDEYTNVTVAWSKNLVNHSLSISMDNYDGDITYTCKVDLKPWPFWSKKGLKSLEIDGGRRVDIFWDLRSAKFSNSPEPSGGYYVAVVCDDEVILLLGDFKKEAYKRTKSRPSPEEATLVSKRENVFGKKCFSARAKFDDRSKEHDIVVENSISGPKDSEMWISVDGIVLLHVNNLRWKFRGNTTVLIGEVPVQVFWDVHDWLFASPGSGHALFIFKPGLPDPVGDDDGDDDDDDDDGERSCSSWSYGGDEISSCGCEAPEFYFFLHACKME